MIAEDTTYQLWVNWDEHIASVRPIPGFEAVTFFSEDSFQKNLQILIQSGFQIQ